MNSFAYIILLGYHSRGGGGGGGGGVKIQAGVQAGVLFSARHSAQCAAKTSPQL